MSEGIVNLPNGKILIFDGCNPLPGCPENWEQAKEWEEKANGEKDKFTNPIWSWDCGFKLDFDGPLVSVSSRFYPPKTHYGPRWDGTIHIEVLGKEVITREFDCASLEELRGKAEAFVQSFVVALTTAILGEPQGTEKGGEG